MRPQLEMSVTMRRVVGSLLTVLLASGATACDSEPKLTGSQIFANEHEAELRSFRKKVTAATAAAAAAPPLEKDGFNESVALDTREYRSGQTDTGNTRTWQLAQLQDTSARPEVRLGGVTHDLRDLDEWLADTSRLPLGSAEMERFLALEYILVLRVLRAQAPKQSGDKSFTGGGVAAEARLYRLADGAELGGVRFGSLSSSSVEVRGAAATSKGLDRDISLSADLSVRAHQELGRALADALPGIVQDVSYSPPSSAGK